jgi:hypothetical protein
MMEVRGHLSLHKKRQELASLRHLTDILIIAIVGGDAASSLCGHDVVLHRHWLNIGID